MISLLLWVVLAIIALPLLFADPVPPSPGFSDYVLLGITLLITAVFNFLPSLVRGRIWKIPAQVYHIVLGLMLALYFSLVWSVPVSIPILEDFVSPLVQSNVLRGAAIGWGTFSVALGVVLSLPESSSIFLRPEDFWDVLAYSFCSSCGISLNGPTCPFCDVIQVITFYLLPLDPPDMTPVTIEFEHGSLRRFIGRKAYREGFIDLNEHQRLRTISRYHASFTYDMRSQTTMIQRASSSGIIQVNNQQVEYACTVRIGDIITLGDCVFLFASSLSEVILAYWQPTSSSDNGASWLSFVEGFSESKIIGSGTDSDIRILDNRTEQPYISIAYEFATKRFRVENLTHRENSVRLGPFELEPLEYDFIEGPQATKIQILGSDYLFVPVLVPNAVSA